MSSACAPRLFNFKPNDELEMESRRNAASKKAIVPTHCNRPIVA